MKTTLLTTLAITLLTLLSTITNAQYETRPYKNAWELGINGGASWQEADIRSTPGWGVGLTLGRNIWHRPGGFIDFDLRGRLLYTKTFGVDNSRSYDLEHNPIFNGQSGEHLNYHLYPGYVYQNHKTDKGELALEGVLTANRLREKTGVILSVFGGIGADLYATQTDQLDRSGSKYEYALIDEDASRGRALRELSAMRDDNFETLSDGFDNGAKISIMPAWGFGLGYELSPGFSVGVEHKITYPLHDYLDGQRFAETDLLDPENDKHHYTALYMRWKIFGNQNKHKDPVYDRPTVIEPTLPKPIVRITRPGGNNYRTDDITTEILANISNVDSRKDVECKVNGRTITNFNFDARTGKFATIIALNPGYNSVEVQACNPVGADSDEVTIIYEPVDSYTPTKPYDTQPTLRPPVVDINFPYGSNTTSTEERATIKATILNISNSRAITYTINGVTSRQFEYNPGTKKFISYPDLKPGRNTIEITAVNSDGSDSDSRTIYFDCVVTRPEVTIIDPNDNPHYYSDRTVKIKAEVTGVESRSEIQFEVGNYVSDQFSYNQSTGIFSAVLNPSNDRTVISITASNNTGSDSDSRTLIKEKVVPKPVVRITKPYTDPSISQSPSVEVFADIQNINSRDQITFKINGQKKSSFNFNSQSGVFSATASLNEGGNEIEVIAKNASGIDIDSRSVTYKRTYVRPTVNITNPRYSPFETGDDRIIIRADITNVKANKDVIFIVNGRTIKDFSFNAKTGDFSGAARLSAGKNRVVITAWNGDYSASDERTINVAIPEPDPGPVVKITRPASQNEVSQSELYKVQATITGLKNEYGEKVTFTVNGRRTNSYSFLNLSLSHLSLRR